MTIKGEDLLNIGYEANATLGLALKIGQQALAAHRSAADVLVLLADVRREPMLFVNDPLCAPLAHALLEHAAAQAKKASLRAVQLPYEIFGEAYIDPAAKAQMQTAMRLPVTVAGALMPDAHAGYGLPIGGVLATDNAVIPYGVGVDIGCRMALSIFDLPAAYLLRHDQKLQKELVANTVFGAGNGFTGRDRATHDLLDSDGFKDIKIAKGLKDKAWSQLGTSGGGNHFVEFGVLTFEQPDAELGIPAGQYLALLSHSGSRGFGATIAGHYTRLAKTHCELPKEAAHLAYLSLDSEEGQEYWQAMELAGAYAAACHNVIHRKLHKAIGGKVLATVENHHNFAWKETWNGKPVIVHRKGATPAAEGVLGIIPGSMTAPGFLVRGRGFAPALHSASHGAGRLMSRTQANQTITLKQMREALAQHGVTLIGAGKDEAPMAYKDIHTVMAAQQELVSVLATFQPKIVRMADDGSKED